jgi:hypothetical protein
MWFAPRDLLMLKILGVAALVLLGAYLALVLWLTQTDFMAEDFPGSVSVENLTGRELILEARVEGERWIRMPGSVPANRYNRGSISAAGWDREDNLVGRDGCTYVPLRAMAQGREVARHPPPLCEGETWVIEPGDEPNR